MTSDDLTLMLEAKTPVVRALLTDVQGSTPREAGAEMFVSSATCIGTIGGGRLEYQAIEAARALLTKDDLSGELRIPLGPEIGQCCGGRVTVSLSRMTTSDRKKALSRTRTKENSQPHVYILGSGHVGRALADQFQHLPLRVIVVDQRESELAQCHASVETRLSAIPEDVITSAPVHSAFIILTHDHGLDFLLTGTALERGDAAYVGLIGSTTKRTKFEKWFREQGSAQFLDSLVCPIGRSGIDDKRPEIIASFVSSEVVAAIAGRQAALQTCPKVNAIKVPAFRYASTQAPTGTSE